jgi:hypothetical protein
MPKKSARKPSGNTAQAQGEAKGAPSSASAATTAAAAQKPTAMIGVVPLVLAALVCAVAVLLGSGVMQRVSRTDAAARRAELKSLKLSELIRLAGDHNSLSEGELDDAIESDDPKSALIAAILELRGLTSLVSALGLASATSQPIATCGAVLLVSDGRDCARASDQQRRCDTISESYAQVRDTVSTMDVLQFITINAQDEPTFVERLMGIGSRADLGWASASLPILYFAKTRTDLRNPADYDATGDRLISALISGEEVPDAYSFSPFTLSAYLRQACGDELVDASAFENEKGVQQHKLAAAATAGDATLVQKLLSQVSPVPATSTNGNSECGHRSWRELCWEPLHAAFRWWKPAYGVPGQVITALLDTDMSINTIGASGHTVLHRLIFEWGLAATAEEHDPTPLMAWLLERPDVDLTQVDSNHQTVLHMAGASTPVIYPYIFPGCG